VADEQFEKKYYQLVNHQHQVDNDNDINYNDPNFERKLDLITEGAQPVWLFSCIIPNPLISLLDEWHYQVKSVPHPTEPAKLSTLDYHAFPTCQWIFTYLRG
jgi:hypothetical protein